ncbi:hypothetical protein [Nonomuraea basaltis]|uniref:hypothetical protein n=1 Tax=Nonomuraea basaltis TaxID=2495887 RepID=UPI00197E49EF|nr:hypothetical protein [Nonomuraea basaltis]
MRRMLAVLVAAVAALSAVTVPAAAAGGWAVTYLDPLPARFEDGRPYALGFWVLQHGTHPFEGELGAVGLRLTREKDGKSLSFDGTALPEAGHYATSVVVPEGVWKVEGIQGMFQPHDVGVLTVPGGLEIKPVGKEVVEGFVSRGTDYWDAVRPPGFPDLPGEKVTVGSGHAVPTVSPQGAVATAVPQVPVATASAQEKVAAGEAAQRQESGGVPAYTLLIAAVGGALLAAAGLQWLPLPRLSPLSRLPGRSRRREDEPDPPADSSSETIVISG